MIGLLNHLNLYTPQLLYSAHNDSGGTTERISYSDKEKEVVSAYVYHSAGVDSGNLDGNVKNFATDIQKLIPDLHTLLTKY